MGVRLLITMVPVSVLALIRPNTSVPATVHARRLG